MGNRKCEYILVCTLLVVVSVSTLKYLDIFSGNGTHFSISKTRFCDICRSTRNLSDIGAKCPSAPLIPKCAPAPDNLEPTLDPENPGRPIAPMMPDIPPDNFTDVETMKKEWRGHCSYPTYIPKQVQKESWFPRYLYHLHRVDLSTSSVARRHINCARWWYATPQITYDEIPHRDIQWTPKPPPPDGWRRPKCPFGQQKVGTTKCGEKHKILWRTLDKWGILYFPRCGTELGILRGGGYVKSDGDIDVFIDYPPKYLVTRLKEAVSPNIRLKGDPKAVKTETQWKVYGCPNVNMVFNDWMTDEMVRDFGRPTFSDTCECMMNSVPLSCHKQALRRTYLMYGPSWRVPLHAKGLDVPHRARPWNVNGKLKKWTSKDGVIHESTLQKLDEKIVYDRVEMEMSLAHTNVLKNLIDYQEKTKDYKWV